jgi:hypothetical protein
MIAKEEKPENKCTFFGGFVKIISNSCSELALQHGFLQKTKDLKRRGTIAGSAATRTYFV